MRYQICKAEKIYNGFYACGEYSIEHKSNDYWYIFNKQNEVVSVKNTLKDAVSAINNYFHA